MTRQRRRPQTDLAAQPRGHRHRYLVDMHRQFAAVPVQPAGADPKRIDVAPKRAAPAFGECPAVCAAAVQCDVEGAVIERVCRAAPPGERVVRRKDTADKRNQGYGVAAVVAQPVDIPPDIAIRRDPAVEAKSCNRLAAASRPDNAAIGTPGPGWTLPPAR